MMEINEISTLIIAYAPAITALIGVLVSLIVGIKRVKNNNNKACAEMRQENNKTVKELKEANDNLIEKNDALIKANEELRNENIEFKKALKDFIDKAEEANKKETNVIIKKKRKK